VSEMTLQRFRGCLLGGAVGDALGAPVEFMSRAEIRARFGESGIGSCEAAYGRRRAITDDTRMTLFTAEGLPRAWVRGASKGITTCSGVTAGAYLRALAALTHGHPTGSLAGARWHCWYENWLAVQIWNTPWAR